MKGWGGGLGSLEKQGPYLVCRTPSFLCVFPKTWAFVPGYEIEILYKEIGPGKSRS